MKTILFLASILILTNINAQVNFADHIITTNADGATSVYAGDLDGDGDLDILSTSSLDDKLVWYENLDGQGNFGIQQIIDDLNSKFIDVADLDNDGDMDIVSGTYSDFGNDALYWYENIDGQGNFITHWIDFQIPLLSSIYIIDINGDGYKDILTAAKGSNTIGWYENIEGAISIVQEVISTGNQAHNSVHSNDLDGDGDMDVLVTYYGQTSGSGILWWKNTDGLGDFIIGQVLDSNSGNSGGVNSVFTSDLDGDGDLDVISSFNAYDKIVWYENTDGQGNFGPQEIIYNSGNIGSGAFSVFTGDIDGDGDMDIVSTSEQDDIIVWYENLDGQGDFSNQKIIDSNTDNPQSVFTGDLDGDGDIDVLSASWGDDKIAWYENLSPLSVNENTLLSFSVYPVPTTGILAITSKTTIVKIEIYNTLGQLILSNSLQNTIDISNISQGIYFIKIKDENGIFGTKKVVKK